MSKKSTIIDGLERHHAEWPHPFMLLKEELSVVLESHIQFSEVQLSLMSLLMDNNARPYKENLVSDFRDIEDIRLTDFPARSTGFNHVEHVWDAWRRATKTFKPPREYSRL